MARRRVLLIVETSLEYGRAILRGINRYATAHGPWSMYVDLRELIVAPPAWLDRWQGDGIISRSTTPELAARLQAQQIPVVDLTDIYGPSGLPQMWSDHAAIGRLAAEHLMERGFSHLAFCGFSDHVWSQTRLTGFQTTLAGAGLAAHILTSPWQGEDSPSWDEQQRDLVAWLTQLPRPLGVFACNDLRGQHVLDACRRAELAVPEEVAVVGVDNDALLCELCDPPLSSIEPNAEQLGFEAAALLDGLIAGRTLPPREPVLLEPLGVVTRQSTDVLAIDDPQIAAAVHYIRQHACDGLTVRELLDRVPLSRSVLERRFRRYLQRSPQQEIRLVQLQRVQQLLRDTELPLEQVALRTGFDHPEYLSVVFKRELGETPGQFRRRSRPADS